MPWYFLVLISAFLLGVYAIFQKEGLTKSDPISFTFLLSSTVAVYSLPLIIANNPFVFDTKITLLLAAKAVSASIFFILSAKALKHMEVSEFAPLLNLSPLILLVLSYIFLDERIGLAGIAGVLLIVFGSYVLELKDGLLSPFRSVRDNKYIHLLIIGMVFASFCAIIDRYILSGVEDIWSFFILNNWFVVFALLPFVLLRKEGIKKVREAAQKSYVWFLLGAIVYFGGDFFYFTALAVPAAFVALVIPIKRTSTLVSTIIGGEVLREGGIFKKALACLIMIAGIYLIVI